jgi:hypothetical protein
MMLDNFSGGTMGTCQTGLRDMGLSSLSAPKQLFRPARPQSGETNAQTRQRLAFFSGFLKFWSMSSS